MRINIQPYIVVADEDHSLCGKGCPYWTRFGVCHLDPKSEDGIIARGIMLTVRVSPNNPKVGATERSPYCLDLAAQGPGSVHQVTR
jgi:hypothetical protein